jgi:ArsR family transcriptional regulator
MVAVESLFKAMGDPARIQILRMLARNGEMCVCRITGELNMTQSAVSHHLAQLRHAGLVSVVRKGQWSYYSLCREVLSDTIIPFVSDLLELLDSAPDAAKEACSASCGSEKPM